MEAVVQPMCYESLSSKIQTATSLNGCGRLRGGRGGKQVAYRMRIEKGAPRAESCTGMCNCGERQMTGDRRSRVLGEGRGGTSKGDSAVVALSVHSLEGGTARPLCVRLRNVLEPRLAASVRFGLPPQTPAKIIRSFVPATLRLSHTMALADLNSIQFYQPPTKASLSGERVLKASNAKGPLVVGEEKPPKAPGPSSGWNALWGGDPIEFLDMADPPRREHLSPFRELADLKDTEADIVGKVFGGSLINNH